ncbi:hypothetical protein GCM10023231_11660 [Olivibacter ginsenosidimutans]|uniref:Polysaccharide chain length determinant N-terminal domain-containing protein n=1 Tax=Olivibacter ginsenosidimutans TaxID=1176537 RepID=A0ABP9ASH9_9SPHI
MAENLRSNKHQADERLSLKELVMSVRKALHILFVHWKSIVLAGIIGGIVGLTYSFFTPTSYTATVSFVIDEQQNSGNALGAYAGIASQFGLNLSGSNQGLFSNDNIMEFLKSRSMIQKTLLTAVELQGKRELLVDRYIRFNHLRDQWAKDARLAHVVFQPDTSGIYLQDSLLGLMYKTLLKKNLVIEKPDRKLNIISLSVKTTDELFSKAFAEHLIENVTKHYTQTRTKKSAENLTVLTRMVDSVRRELNAAIGGVAAAAEAHPNANMAFQSLKVPSQKRSVDVEANSAIFSELVKQQELARIALRNDQPLIQVLDRPILPLDKTRVGKMKGMVFGGILFGVLTGLFLLAKAFFRQVMQTEQ